MFRNREDAAPQLRALRHALGVAAETGLGGQAK